MKAELELMVDWSTGKFYLITKLQGECITLNITEDEFRKYEEIEGFDLTQLPF